MSASSEIFRIWTDGSGTSAGSPGAWAYMIVHVAPSGEVHRREGFGGALDATNNRMELSGPIFALRALTPPCRVILHCDSKYVVNAFNHGLIDAWKARGWRKIKNVDLWLELDAEAQRHDCAFEWVRRANDPNNVRCDKLAGQARHAIIEARAAGTIDALPFEPVGHLPKA